jgi:hypothetical protein
MLQSFLPIKDRLSSIFLFALLTVFSGSCGGGNNDSQAQESLSNSWPGNIYIADQFDHNIFSPKEKTLTPSGLIGNEINTNSAANITITNIVSSTSNGQQSTINIISGLNKNKKISEFKYRPRLYSAKISPTGEYIMAEIDNENEVLGPYTFAIFDTKGKIIWQRTWPSNTQNGASIKYDWLTKSSFILIKDKTVFQYDFLKDSYTSLVTLNKLPPEGYSDELKISPDKKKIAFTWRSDSQGGLTIWIASLDGSELRPLTAVSSEEIEWFKLNNPNFVAAHSFITWSPDGKWIGGVIRNTSQGTTLPVNSSNNEAYGDMGEYAPIQNNSCNIPFIIPSAGPVQVLNRYKMKKEIVPMAHKLDSSYNSPISICNGGMQWMP